MSETFNPPSLYEAVVVERTDSARAHAERLASQGAEEGTIVWAKSQNEGLGRNRQQWFSGTNNLHLATILRPDDPYDVVCQLSLVATLCVATALAEQAEPMSELRYRWPNDVLLNRGKVAGITLSGQLRDDARVEWLVLGVNVNVWEQPGSLGFDSASMRGEGFEMHDRTRLAVSFCRQFLAWGDRWANEGFEVIRKAWQVRGTGDPLPHTITLANESKRGRFENIDHEGSLLLRPDTTRGEKIRLADFFRPDFAPAQR